MVTFAAATKNTPSFPSRAPAQSRVDHFVAITCSDPNDSCDLYNTDCRSYAQLVSPSRDPVGFEGSKWGLYEAFLSAALLGKDPTGLACWCGEKIKCLASFGPFDCLTGSDCADTARSEAASSGMPGRTNGKEDSLRHCIWTCCMARMLGEDTARAIGDFHEECNPSKPAETCMDKLNNDAGVSIGLNHKGTTCLAGCLGFLKAGELQTAPGCPGRPDNIPGKRTRPKGSIYPFLVQPVYYFIY
jgi:hypothetical protein